jgi:hypothetical protein
VALPRTDLRLEITGPDRLRAGETADLTVTATNNGETALRNLALVYEDQANLTAAFATEGFSRSGWRLIRTIGELSPGARVSYQVRVQGNRVTDRACNQATITSQDGLRRQADKCLEIMGGAEPPPAIPQERPAASAALPADGVMRMAIDAVADGQTSARIGDHLKYVVTIANDRPVGDQHLVLTLHLSGGLQFGRVDGRGPHFQASGDGLTLELTPITEIRPREVIPLEVEVRALRRGAASLRAELSSRGLSRPLIVQERLSVQ